MINRSRRRNIVFTFGILFLLVAMLMSSGCGTIKKTNSGSESEGEDQSMYNDETTGTVTSPEVNQYGVLYSTTDKRGIINSISELNTKTEKLDSHAGEMANSYIKFNYRETEEIAPGNIGGTPYYPRVKTMANGKYLMTYQNAQSKDGSVFYRISSDLKKWSEPRVLFKKTTFENGYVKSYATCDSVVLNDGTILSFAIYMSPEHFWEDPNLGGIVMKRSTDNGATWSVEKEIYRGYTWEPYPLQLESGEIQVYLSHGAPFIYRYGYDDRIRSSGSAIVRSFDGGETWTPSVTGAPYEADRVSSTYIGTLDGIKRFNDQMPVAVQLHNGNIALAVETRMFGNNFMEHHVSLGVSYDNWAHPLGPEDVGPNDKIDLGSGAGPYIRQFDSGETLVTTGWKNIFLGDETAHNFKKLTKEFTTTTEVSDWTSLEVLSSHSMLYATISNVKGSNTITLRKLYLNHRINAEKTTIKIDGQTDDWSASTDALFVGSQSQAQVALRSAHDSDNIYFLIERLDYYLSETGDETTIIFSADGGKTKYKVVAAPDGKVILYRQNGAKYSAVESSQISAAMTVAGDFKKGVKDEGYLVEIAIPKSLIKSNESDTIYVDVLLDNTDKGVKFDTERMYDQVDGDGISKCGKIVLK